MALYDFFQVQPDGDGHNGGEDDCGGNSQRDATPDSFHQVIQPCLATSQLSPGYPALSSHLSFHQVSQPLSSHLTFHQVSQPLSSHLSCRQVSQPLSSHLSFHQVIQPTPATSLHQVIQPCPAT